MMVGSADASWRRYLVWFAHHNLYYNMRFQELEALAEMCGISRAQLYRCGDSNGSDEMPSALTEEPYVYVWLPVDRVDEIVKFLLSRAVLIKVVVEVWAEGADYGIVKQVASEKIPKVGDTGKHGTATTESSDVMKSLQDRSGVRHQDYVNADVSFCFRCVAFGKTLSYEYKQAKIIEMGDFLFGPVLSSCKSAESDVTSPTAAELVSSTKALQAPGAEDHEQPPRKLQRVETRNSVPFFKRPHKIDLEDPECMLMLLEDYGVDDSHKLDKTLRRVFFGRHIGSGRTFVGGAGSCVAAGSSSSSSSRAPANAAIRTAPQATLTKTQKNKTLAFYEKYALGRRCILGPTTMENELAFLMANCGQVTKTSVALDPFCGTGGLLIPMAHFGCLTMGTDLDIRVLKGWRIAYQKNVAMCKEIELRRGHCVKNNPAVPGTGAATEQQKQHSSTLPACDPATAAGSSSTVTTSTRSPAVTTAAVASARAPPQTTTKGSRDQEHDEQKPLRSKLQPMKDVFMNFYQYHLKRPEIVVTDNARKPWRTRSCGWLDAIVTDPPYGIRAASRKVQLNQTAEGGDDPRIYDRSNYIPRKDIYEEDEILQDLLSFAKTSLVDDGKLVFLLPIDLQGLVAAKSATAGVGDREVEPAVVEAETVVDSLKSIREKALPGKKDKKTKKQKNVDWFTNCTRDPIVLDERNYRIPTMEGMKKESATVQILSGGLGRLLVVMRRIPRKSQEKN
ncbi:unnamed protein product [Amoebophrya sp. A120]|nr:unnamed protein product [Amoebophrya sp. A120]|eukprot:GSA120T00002502001.1